MPGLGTKRKIWISIISFGAGVMIGLKWDIIYEKLKYAGSLFK